LIDIFAILSANIDDMIIDAKIKVKYKTQTLINLLLEKLILGLSSAEILFLVCRFIFLDGLYFFKELI